MSIIPIQSKETIGSKHSRNYLRSFSQLYEQVAGTGLVPPQALEIEQSVLGAMMIDKAACSRVIEVIGERDYDDSPFYRESHTAIYRAIINLDSIGSPVDIKTVYERLKLEGYSEESGGPAYLVELTSKVVTTANVEAHSRLIIEKFLARETIRNCEETKLRAFLGEDDTFELIDNHNSRMFDLGAVRHKKSGIDATSLHQEILDNLERIQTGGGLLPGVPSGLEDLDRLTTGWQKTDLIIVAARPSMGKSALMMTLVRNAILHPVMEMRVPVAVFSLEMGAQQLVLRSLCQVAEVNSHTARSGKLTTEDWNRLRAADVRLKKLGPKKLILDDTAGISDLELRAKCRRFKQTHGIGLVIVDYLQLMTCSKKVNSRELEIAHIARSLKNLAKELDLPVIALSQLNRSLEARHDKRPMLSDLRESGEIEQAADNVIFIYRPEVYGIEQYEGGRKTEGSAELIIAKQRNGPIGSAFTAYRGDYGRFDNLAQRDFGEEEGGSF